MIRPKYGIRFDGNGEGHSGYIHHNIGWNCEGGIMVKGGMIDPNTNVTVGGHFVYNNTFLNSVDKNDIMVLAEQNNQDINFGSVVMNNLCEKLSAHRTDDLEFPSRITNLTNFTQSEIESLLTDFNSRDFRPINNPLLIFPPTVYSDNGFAPSFQRLKILKHET